MFSLTIALAPSSPSSAEMAYDKERVTMELLRECVRGGGNDLKDFLNKICIDRLKWERRHEAIDVRAWQAFFLFSTCQ